MKTCVVPPHPEIRNGLVAFSHAPGEEVLIKQKTYKIIKSVKLYFHNHNKIKQERIKIFIQEYRRVLGIILEDLKQIKDLPLYLDYSPYKSQTWLSARMLRRIADNAIQIVSGIRNRNQGNESYNTDKINPFLNTNFYKVNFNSKYFDEFLILYCLGNKLQIPLSLNYHRHYYKLSKEGRRMGGIELNEKWIKINFEIEIKQKTEGKICGADQGINKVLTLSDNQRTPKEDNHGHSLNSILNKLTRKKKGSKAFRKAQKHRDNFINWSINRLNLDKIKELRIESLKGFAASKIMNRRSSHWHYTAIDKKILTRCLELGVRVIKQNSKYRSQRCSACGLVLKTNRCGELYTCSCGFKADADFNAARNHELDLAPLPLNTNSRSGFYWPIRVSGQEFTVPATRKIERFAL